MFFFLFVFFFGKVESGGASDIFFHSQNIHTD